MNGETVEGVFGESFSRSGDDGIAGTVFLGVAKEFVNDAGFDVAIRSKDSGFDVGGAKDFVDVTSDDGFAGGTGDADEFEGFGGMAVIGFEDFGTSAGGAGSEFAVVHIIIISR